MARKSKCALRGSDDAETTTQASIASGIDGIRFGMGRKIERCRRGREAAARPSQRTDVKPYRKIFASYSHRDTVIVEQFERYAAALGDRCLRDTVELRAGELWNDRLMEMIREADVFQLFWSSNSMHSDYVQQEYECAMSLGRQNFVRPLYWEDPLPRSPPELPPIALENLHFQRLGRYVQCNDAPDLAADEVQEPDANYSFESPFTDEAIPSSTRLAVDDAVSDESFESFDECEEADVISGGDDDFDAVRSDVSEPRRATRPAGLDAAPQRGRGLVERAVLVVYVLILLGVIGVLGLVLFKLISHYAAKS